MATSLARVGRGLLGVAVFVAALGLWEAWARSKGSFLVPPASAVVEAAWDVWPTTDFLATVGASLRRLAAGYAIGAVIGIAVGLLMGASRGTRRTLEPFVEFARATPAIAIMPAAIVLLGLGNGMRISVIAFGRVLSGAHQHGRGRPRSLAGGARHRLDAAREPG